MESSSQQNTAFDSEAQLQAELELLELILRREVVRAREERGPGGRYDEFSGLIVSDEEIERYLVDTGRPTDGGKPPDLAPLELQIAVRRVALERQRQSALTAALPLRLEHIRQAFSLDDAEYQTLIACLAPELDLRFERYFAYLQNDVSKKRPSVQLLCKLFYEGASRTSSLRRLVAADDSLVAVRLLEPLRAPETGLAARELGVAAGVLNFVLESDALDPELHGVGRWRGGRPLPRGPSYFEHHRRHVAHLLALAERKGSVPRVYVRAPDGCAKEDLVLAVARGLQARVLECSFDELTTCPGDFGDWFAVLERDLRLETGFLWLRWEDELRVGESERARLRAFGRLLASSVAVNLMITGKSAPAELRELLGIELAELEIPAPNPGERLELWRYAVGEEPEAARAGLLESLAAKFKFGPRQIAGALERLRWTGSSETPEDGLEQAIHAVCREESSAALAAHAQKLTVKYTWKDLVVPFDVLEQLREICNAVRYRVRVHGEWGFGDKFSLGKGLTVLFSGPSGTGKTMSTEVLATELSLGLYKIDLSSVVSKYIGETEKNLARIFREAESANCILLFDEADALFGRRSEVKDSHDRYANIEINYLLQRIEEYEGIVVLTTNMLKNLDPAFTRRIHYTVEFPVPDERQRGLLWSQAFPLTTPVAQDINLEFVAKRFKLSGANIKNIALQSAFLAASDRGVIDMGHIVNAISREYRKLGKLASRSEFGAYYHLVQEASEAAAGPEVQP